MKTYNSQFEYDNACPDDEPESTKEELEAEKREDELFSIARENGDDLDCDFIWDLLITLKMLCYENEEVFNIMCQAISKSANNIRTKQSNHLEPFDLVVDAAIKWMSRQ